MKLRNRSFNPVSISRYSSHRDTWCPGFLQSAFAMGTLHVFHDPDRGQAKTNLDDFTDVVVKIASECDRHFAASCELNSDVCHSIHEIARMVSEVTRKDINVQRTSVEPLLRAKYGPSFDADKLRYEIDAFRSMATWCDNYDLIGNTNAMKWLLNRDRTTMATYSAPVGNVHRIN
jgi:hypothetical protein